ncbi:MAG TPA: hypothetical protein VF765_28025 [Polyangiaceae bacterium]
MAEAKPPETPEGVASPLTSPDEVSKAWKAFRAGVAPCPVDGAPLALAVEGTANVYRFVCVKCGAASAWFEAGAGGLKPRGPRAGGPGNE